MKKLDWGKTQLNKEQLEKLSKYYVKKPNRKIKTSG